MLGGAGRYKNGDRKVQPQKKLGVAACWELASKVCYHILLTGLTTPQATSNMRLSFTGVHESKMLCGDLLNLANRCAKHRVPLNLLPSLRCRCFGVDIREMPLGSAEPCPWTCTFSSLVLQNAGEENGHLSLCNSSLLGPTQRKRVRLDYKLSVAEIFPAPNLCANHLQWDMRPGCPFSGRRTPELQVNACRALQDLVSTGWGATRGR